MLHALQNALKHTDAALKKYPGNQLLSSLRAFALQRTGKTNEALATLQSIVDKGPESERVLHTMTFTYRAAGKPEAIVPAYATAADKYPQDLEILKGLFGAYAKELNFVKQQQIALKLAKAHPEEADRYTWWAIISLALQARAAIFATPPGSNAEQLMKLAETMITRQMTKSKGSLPSYEALLLYTDILQGQGKAEEAAKIIKETSGTPAGGLKGDSRQLLAAALVRSGDLSAAAELFKEACLENTDDWWSWHLYLSCILPSSVNHASSELNTPRSVFPVGIVGGLAENWDSKHLNAVWETAVAAGSPSLEERIQTAREVLEAVKTAAKPGSQSRGTALAPLELACRLHRLDIYTGQQLSEALVDVLPSLCHSFSCAVDLRRYTCHLEFLEDREWLAEHVVKICEEQATSFDQESNSGSDKNNKAAIKALWCRTNAHALRQELGFIGALPAKKSQSSDAVDYAVKLIKLFSSNLALSENLDPKDRGHGEDLVALAAGSLVSSVSKRDSNANLVLVTAILALEAAQIRRAVAAPLRLSSCALYALLNCPTKATAQLTALDVKSILHESVTGHWALPTLLASASPESDFEKWLSGISNLHVDQVLEASESIFTAYEQGIYSKVPEFVDFWETLGTSHTRWTGTAERNVLKLRAAAGAGAQGTPTASTLFATASEIVSEMEKSTLPQTDKIRFNEDLSTRPAWFSPAAVHTRLALASWWEAQTAGAMPSVSEMWWGVTGAAERNIPQAQQWRQAQRQGLALRQALPKLLAHLLQQPGSAMKLDEQVLSDALEVTEATYPETLKIPLSILKVLLQAGSQVHLALDEGAEGGEADDLKISGEHVCTSLDALKQQFSTCLKDISESLKTNESLFPFPGNALPAVLAALLAEEVQWTAVCLSTWSKLCKTSFSAADNAQNELKEKLQKALHGTGFGIYLELLALKEHLSALSSSSSSPAVLAAEILTKIESTWPQASTLWSYESKFDAKKVLEEVVAEQQAMMKRMTQLTTQAMAGLKQFAS